VFRLSAIWKGFARLDLGLVGHAGRISFDRFSEILPVGLPVYNSRPQIEELLPVVSVLQDFPFEFGTRGSVPRARTVVSFISCAMAGIWGEFCGERSGLWFSVFSFPGARQSAVGAVD